MQPSAQTTNILIGYNQSHNSRGTISLPCVSPNIAGDRREGCVLPNTGGDSGGEGREGTHVSQLIITGIVTFLLSRFVKKKMYVINQSYSAKLNVIYKQ